ncbi:hypothetical protein [Aeromonas phage AerS_266]|nr:hypothetical protein [Aeromonas phage AerS_266]
MCKLNFVQPKSLVTNKEILPNLRSSFKISDQEFSFLCDIVSVPVVFLVEQGIFTQGIVDKILNGGSDHQKLYLAHREIVFGMGYDKAWKKMTECIANSLFFKPAVAKVNNPNFSDTKMDVIKTKDDRFNNLDPIKQFNITFGSQQLDSNMVLDFGVYLKNKNLDVTEKLLGRKQEKESLKNDKDLVFNSFITFVRKELSDDHESDVVTALEILEDYFTAKQLFAKFMSREITIEEQWLGKPISEIPLKQFIGDIITIIRKIQGIKKCVLDLPQFISIDPDDLNPSVLRPFKQWLVQNCFPGTQTQEVLKTKPLDYQLKDSHQVINIKLMNNDNWGKTLQGIIKIFDDRLVELQAKAEKSFATVLNQIQSGQISYDKVKERLTLPNIHTKNKYNTRYIIKQLGGIPAAKEAIGVTLEDMDEKECIAILKFQIALYQQGSGQFNSQILDQKRKQIGVFLDYLYKETLALNTNPDFLGISRHYKDNELEMMITCKFVHDLLGSPILKTQVDIIRSKHFATERSRNFSSFDFYYGGEEYRNKVMEKVFKSNI